MIYTHTIFSRKVRVNSFTKGNVRSIQQDDQPNSWGTGTWAELSPAPRFAPGPSCGISHGSCTKSLQELQKHSGGRLAHCRAQGAPSQLRGTGPQLALTLHGSGRVSRGREAGSPSPGSVDTAGRRETDYSDKPPGSDHRPESTDGGSGREGLAGS